MEVNSGRNNPQGKKNLQIQINYRPLSDYSPLQCATFIFCRFKVRATQAESQTFSKNGLNHYRQLLEVNLKKPDQKKDKKEDLRERVIDVTKKKMQDQLAF